MTSLEPTNADPSHAIDLDALRILAAYHLAVARGAGSTESGSYPGAQAEELVGLNELIGRFVISRDGRETGDPEELAQLVCRTGQIFGSGVDFGIAIACAIISRPLGDASSQWVAALARARVELREIADYALEEAAAARASGERLLQPT
jgi:hypothetical protein